MQNITSRLLIIIVLSSLLNAVVAHDLTRLPLGDGKISTSPKKGWIWACRIDPNAGGAHRNGAWIKSDGTYDLTDKAVVPGNVSWSNRFNIKIKNGQRIISANDLPSHSTGTFPIPSSSEAYNFDTNPNRIREQNIMLELPANPELASTPSCAPGVVGITLSGVVLFNALDAPGRDAVAHETQDQCQGHPQKSGVYHYHSVSTCVEDQHKPGSHSGLVGYMVDGFGIYGRYGEDGKELSSADLDECHGHTHTIDWDGKQVNMYHYHATWDFPYSAGCLRGKYTMANVMKLSGGPIQRGSQRGRNDMRDGGRMPPSGMDDQGPPQGMNNRQGPPGGQPDLNVAAEKLGISVEKLRAALGPPPPDLRATARKLGITESKLRSALGVP